MPAVVGGGIGDVEEVLCAGRALAREGATVLLYRRPEALLPRGVDGPWAWPPHRRTSRIRPHARHALTVTPAWGITGAPARDEPLGRAGPWTQEVADVERAYGPDRTVHVSLEEFARTLTPRQETRERWREGGVPARQARRLLAGPRRDRELSSYRRAFRRFRAFDRGNVLHLFAGFLRSEGFAREFPEAVQTGPLWPGRGPARRRPPRSDGPWVWYASPASAEGIAAAVARGLSGSTKAGSVTVRTPRLWRRAPLTPVVTVCVDPLGDRTWRQRFRDAQVRVVTGSRSLLEALEHGGPFLYFNGVLGVGAARRRHRPEKILAFLALAQRQRWPSDLRADLADFSLGHRVEPVVRRAAAAEGSWRRFPLPPRPQGYPTGFEDAGRVLVEFARAFAVGGAAAPELVAETRGRSNP